MTEETWVCTSCGQRNNAIDRNCVFCRGSTTFRHQNTEPAPKKFVDPSSLVFPLTIPEVRYNLPLTAGPQWTSGEIRVTEKGLYVLSASDKIDPATLGVEPEKSTMVAPLSAYMTKGDIKQVVNSRTLGQGIDTADLRIPLRLTADGWATLEAACRRIGVAYAKDARKTL